MSRLGKFVVAISAVWFVVATTYFSHRGGIFGILQLALLPLFPCLLAAIAIGFVCIFKDWRTKNWRSLIPIAICISSIVLSGILVQIIRRVIQNYSLPIYEAVVKKMETREIFVSTNLSLIPEAKSEARFAYAVLAKRETNGVLEAEFLTEVGFPVKHSGYFYSSDGKIEHGSRIDERWPIRVQIKDKWFYVSD
jgi:MFS family permease